MFEWWRNPSLRGWHRRHMRRSDWFEEGHPSTSDPSLQSIRLTGTNDVSRTNAAYGRFSDSLPRVSHLEREANLR